MKKVLVAIVLIIIITVSQKCKKSSIFDNTNSNGNKDTAVATPVGVPNGPSVSKFISTSGGNITSADGRVELIFPNGAITKGDTISIQNITNFGPLGIGDAYRLLPEGLSFSNPVTIKFHYSSHDTEGTIPKMMHLAYQQANGKWKLAGNVILDEASSTLTLTTSHFSDWDIFSDLTIMPTDPYNLIPIDKIRINNSQGFKIIYVNYDSEDELISPNNMNSLDVSSEIVKNWSVNSIVNGNAIYGKIVSDNGLNSGFATATYTAPSAVPQDHNPVAISAVLQNLNYLDSRLGSFNGLTLTYSIKIIGKDYSYKVYMYSSDNRVDGGLPGLPFTANDTVFFKVDVKNLSDVTISEIQNYKLSVTPGSQSTTGCTSTWDGSGDFWDIISGSGSVTENGSNIPASIQILLNNKLTNAPAFNITNCDPNMSVGGFPNGNTQVGVFFQLVDTLQIITDTNGKVLVAPI